MCFPKQIIEISTSNMLKVVRVTMLKEFLPQVINCYDKPVQHEWQDKPRIVKQSKSFEPSSKHNLHQADFPLLGSSAITHAHVSSMLASDILSKIHEIRSFLAGLPTVVNQNSCWLYLALYSNQIHVSGNKFLTRFTSASCGVLTAFPSASETMSAESTVQDKQCAKLLI